MAACACAGEIPGPRRAKMFSQRSWRLSSPSQLGVTSRFMAMGTYRSGLWPERTPRNPPGATPTTTMGWPLMATLAFRDARLAREAPHPVIVTQHNYGMRSGRAVVLGCKRAAHGGSNTETSKKLPETTLGVGALGLAIPGDAEGTPMRAMTPLTTVPVSRSRSRKSRYIG